VKLALLVLLGVAAPAQALDLLAVHELARQQAPALRGAEAGRAEQQARLQQAKAQLAPQLDAVLARSDSNGASAGPASLQLTQKLFDAPRWHQRSAEQQRLQAREAESRLAEQQLRQDSARLYLQWHAQAELLQVQRGLAQALAEEAARMAVRHREGLAAAVDWRQSQSFQWLAEANTRGAARQLQAEQEALAAHAGARIPRIQPLRSDALPPAPAQAAHDSPRLRALQSERSARSDELDAARQAAWPSFSLQAQTQRELQSTPRTSSHEWTLQLRVPLWDGGSLAAGREAAQARLEAQDAAVQQAERDLLRDLATWTERLHAAREQHTIAQGALTAAAQTVTAMRVGQEQGSRSTSDVLNALQLQAQLRALVVQAQAEAWQAWIALLASRGAFDNAALQTLNAQLQATREQPP
jgi:outer membrane protein